MSEITRSNNCRTRNSRKSPLDISELEYIVLHKSHKSRVIANRGGTLKKKTLPSNLCWLQHSSWLRLSWDSSYKGEELKRLFYPFCSLVGHAVTQQARLRLQCRQRRKRRQAWLQVKTETRNSYCGFEPTLYEANMMNIEAAQDTLRRSLLSQRDWFIFSRMSNHPHFCQFLLKPCTFYFGSFGTVWLFYKEGKKR